MPAITTAIPALSAIRPARWTTSGENDDVAIAPIE